MRHTIAAALALLAAAPLCAQASISPLPTPPSRNDPNNFSARSDAFLGALPGMAAQMNAVAAQTQAAANSAINAPGTLANTSTTMTLGTGTRSFTVQAGKAYIAGQFVLIAATIQPGAYMNGQITAYDASSGAMTVAVGYAQGVGSASAWNVALSTPVDPSRFVTKGQGAGQLSNAISIGWDGNRLKGQVDSTDLGRFVFDSQLANYQTALGYTPVRQGTGVGQGSNTISLGWDGSRLKGQVDSSDLGRIVFDSNLTSALAGYQPLLNYTPANRAGDTFTGSITAPGVMSTAPLKREANNYLDQDGSGYPVWVVKAGSYTRYDRVNDKFLWVINNVVVGSLDGGGNLTIRGNLFPNGTP
jgi:hypothetical protein